LCGTEYENEDEAWDCIRECQDMGDTPDEVEVNGFVCEFCGDDFEFYKNAKDCEQTHEENQDNFWLARQRKEEMARLEAAASHHDQKRVAVFVGVKT
jgi:hypothetical protein